MVAASMCGISGIIAPPGGGDLGDDGRLRSSLEAMAAGLAHRGPDAAGVITSGAAGLAHTRLSIIDLTPTGAQPMWSPDRRFVIAFNGDGEILMNMHDPDARYPTLTGVLETQRNLYLTTLYGNVLPVVAKQDL